MLTVESVKNISVEERKRSVLLDLGNHNSDFGEQCETSKNLNSSQGKDGKGNNNNFLLLEEIIPEI